MNAMEISRSGLDVEWRRLEVIATNLANLSTTRTALGGPFQAMRLISGPTGDFASHLAAGSDAATQGFTGEMRGVAVYGVEPTETPARRVYEPEHPHADAEGFVLYPAIDHAGEMTLMVKTARSYEANLVALNAARQMYVKAMDIGRR